MLEVFRFMKLVGKPSNAIQRNSKLRMMSSGPKKPPNKSECKNTQNLEIRGGNKCKPKEKKSVPEPDQQATKNGKKPLSCEELLMKKDKKLIVDDLTVIQGGGSKTNCKPKPKKPASADDIGSFWKRISLGLALPMIAILTIFVFTTRSENERPEFVYYPHMYKRSKPYWFGDGNRTAFHNEHWNALPPIGYEDEVDMDAAPGETAETENEKKSRQKEFDKVKKQWDKHAQKREKERKKEEEIAKKLQEKQQQLEENLAESVTEKDKKEVKYNQETDDKPKVTNLNFRRKLKNSVYNVVDDD